MSHRNMRTRLKGRRILSIIRVRPVRGHDIGASRA